MMLVTLLVIAAEPAPVPSACQVLPASSDANRPAFSTPATMRLLQGCASTRPSVTQPAVVPARLPVAFCHCGEGAAEGAAGSWHDAGAMFESPAPPPLCAPAVAFGAPAWPAPASLLAPPASSPAAPAASPELPASAEPPVAAGVPLGSADVPHAATRPPSSGQTSRLREAATRSN